MAKIYDAALKQLVDAFAADWLAWLGPRLGLPANTVYEPLDADLSTVSPQADKLFRMSGPTSGVVHLELQTSWDDRLADRLLVYNVLAEYRHGGPVQTVLMLLRRDANSPALTGQFRRASNDGRVYLEFRYAVVRAWELRAEELLAGPLGMLPLAAITDDAQAVLPDVVTRFNDRIVRNVLDSGARETLRATAYILLGLRHDDETINRLFQGLKTMEESTTYQYILRRGEAQGRAVEARRIIGLLGEQRFGPPLPAVDAALDAITDPDRLERVVGQLLKAAAWDDLLATP